MDRKQRLRLIIAGAFVAVLILVYGVAEGTHPLFWIAPLVLAVVVYNFLLWGERCPACRRDFALVAQDSDAFRTTWQCRYCDHRLRRINMHPSS